MKYQITFNDDDYLKYNIFYAYHSKSGKRSVRVTQLATPILSTFVILILYIANVEARLFWIELVMLTVLSIVMFVLSPKRVQNNICRTIKRMKADGKLPYHTSYEMEFQDSVILQRSDKGEFRQKYEDIEAIYFDKEYIYIFIGATQALILPYRCVGEDKERIMHFLMEKRPDAWHNAV